MKTAYDVTEYSFSSLVDDNPPVLNSNVTEYKIREFSKNDVVSKKKMDRIIRKERNLEKKSLFKIADIVRKDRGLEQQEEEDFEKRVEAAVTIKIAKIKDDAYQDGYKTGEERGHAEALEKATIEYEDRVNRLNEMIDAVVAYKQDLLDKQRDTIYRMVRSLCKWVLLKEIKEDGDYLNRLLEKLILELHSKSDLLIKVDEASFENMPRALEIVQKKLGDFPNVRLEIERGLGQIGIILESSNGIIDGTLDAQLKSIDRLFVDIGVSDDK